MYYSSQSIRPKGGYAALVDEGIMCSLWYTVKGDAKFMRLSLHIGSEWTWEYFLYEDGDIDELIWMSALALRGSHLSCNAKRPANLGKGSGSGDKVA